MLLAQNYGVVISTRAPRRDRSRELDAVDRRLLYSLSRDGRQAASTLAKELGLSRQAVTERIRDLERRGVIRGYRADVDPVALGLSVRAHIRLTLDSTQSVRKEPEVMRRLLANPLIRSVHRVSGEDCFVVEMVCRTIEDVNTVLLELLATRAVQSSRTAFVLETVVEKDALGPLEAPLLGLPPRG
jgi:Lrp/AsnC family leucine-responsive transcriptional regulator